MEEDKRSCGRIFLDGLYYKNPVLSLFLGLTLAVLCTTTLESALFISVIVLIDLVIVETFLSAVRKWMGKLSSYLLALNLSAHICTALAFLIAWLFPYAIIESVAPYESILINALVPFIATSSVILCKGREANHLRVGQALCDSLGSGIGFMWALLLIALIREILGTGELCFTISMTEQIYVHLFDTGFDLMVQPVGGLFLTGFISGIHLGFVRRHDKKLERERNLAQIGE